MAFEIGDPFDVASPGTPQMHEPYDDLLGVEVPVEDLEMPVADFEGDYSQMSYRPPVVNMMSARDQDADFTGDQQSLEPTMMDPCDFGANPLETNADLGNIFRRNATRQGQSEGIAPTEPARISAVLNGSPSSHNTSPANVRASNLNSKTSRIKNEVLDIPFTFGISLNTIDDPVQISDTEDTDSVPIKKEDDEVEFLWEKMGDHVIELDSDNDTNATSALSLGKSFLKRPDPKPTRLPIDSLKARRAQEAYLKTRRLNHGIPERLPERKVLNGLEVPVSKDSGIPIDDDESAWMKADYIPDEDNGKTFRALKKSYNAKVRTDSNTATDDVEYTKAEKAENLRLARLKAEYENARGYSDDDNSDDGLFVSPSLATNSRPKRRAFDSPEVEDENMDSRRTKQRKPNGNGKRARQGLDEEQETNMMAGLEEFIRKNYGEDGEKSGGKGKGKSGTKVSKRSKRRSKKAGYLSHSNSLLTSNVYEDADASLNREALPISGHTNKQKALAALVASVPLGTTEKDAASEKNLIRKATVTLARNIQGSCKPDGNNNWKLPGLKSSLRHHQVLGAAFLAERENGGEEPLGGILADAMGLGKTIMTLALITANPPPRGEKDRATLIVCTPGLLAQWEREIKKHTEAGHLEDVLMHYSGRRISGTGAVRFMQNAEIILTTYQEVVKSYPKLDAPEDIHEELELKAWWEKQWNQERDILHQVRFYRVVLDEAQVIKNHMTQTSIACRALMAKRRLAVSATPIANTVDELYPYFKFLRVPYTGSFGDFQERYCKPGSDDCNSRLHCLLDQIMCRRTFKDTILGAPIVKLPMHHQRTKHIQFSPVEKAIYRRVFKKYVGALNKASADGMLEKHQGFGLIAFLRLRQMCAHTFLVQEVLEELLDLESIDNMEREFICGATLENKNDRNLLAALRRMIEARPKAIEEPKEPEEPEQVQTGELAAKFGSYLKSLKANTNWTELRARTQCHSCGDPPESAMVTSCLHLYCEECFQGLANKASAEDQDETTCLECGVVFTGAEPCTGLKELEWDERWLLNDAARRNKGPKKVNMEWVCYENKLVMSAKITAVQTQVEEWLKEEPDKKIIIFSQFHMVMQLLEKVCQKKKWKYCTYHGKMSHQARDTAIADFDKDDDMKIMIASFKCGGVGLNLTMASKVICIDLWFNSCMEQQAFCRVFRIGQESETFITRFIVEDSADGKLVDMQLRKNALISRAMEDRSIMSKLSVEEVLRLFGDVRLDKDKRPFIHLEDDEKLDSLFEKKSKE